jgi:hypothetical protein
MPYNVRADSIAQDIDEEVKKSILEFLKTYDFRYVRSIMNKSALREVFIEHFKNRHDLRWLKQRLYYLARREGRSLRGVAAVAWTETNRIHTMGLGTLLLSKGIKKCTTVHSYGWSSPMRPVCRRNLEGKQLDIQEIINNSFPKRYEDLMRTDIPMIPQHVNCRHVMAPIEEK